MRYEIAVLDLMSALKTGAAAGRTFAALFNVQHAATNSKTCRDCISSDDAPQQGTPEGMTSSAHMAASCVKASDTPIFLLEQGTCTATRCFTCVDTELRV